MAKIVDETFDALFALTDVRQLLRDTKPTYRLTQEQKALLDKRLERARKAISAIEEEFSNANKTQD
jgi:DNA-binding PadR family transcriptional regulator